MRSSPPVPQTPRNSRLSQHEIFAIGEEKELSAVQRTPSIAARQGVPYKAESRKHESTKTRNREQNVTDGFSPVFHSFLVPFVLSCFRDSTFLESPCRAAILCVLCDSVVKNEPGLTAAPLIARGGKIGKSGQLVLEFPRRFGKLTRPTALRSSLSGTQESLQCRPHLPLAPSPTISKCSNSFGLLTRR
jgi:hypothetical protein